MIQMTTAAPAATKPLRKPKLTVDDMHIKPYRIFNIQSTKGATDVMMAEIMYQLDQIPGVTYRTDDYGNLYATKGNLTKDEKYPAFVCHTDTVHKIFKTKYTYRTSEGNYFAMCYDDGPEQIGIGGDDFCGIICNIELMWRLPKMKAAFFLDEENGCLGSKAGDLTFFDDCRYAIQIDRKGNTDIIVNGNNTRLCSEEFEKALNALGEVYGYTSTTGRRSDVIMLKERGLGISAVNLSAGYYKEHTKQEYVSERDLLNVIEFCIAISKDKKVYPHVYQKPDYSKSQQNCAGFNSPYHSNHRYSPPPLTGRVKRLCKDCKTAELSDREGIICVSCLNKVWETYKLKVNERTGEKFLIIETCDANESIQDDADDTSKKTFSFGCSDTCLLCERMVFSDIERDRGYCEECAICKWGTCKTKLLLSDNVKSGYCPEHIKILDENLTCGMMGCYNKLVTEGELMEEICTSCVKLIRLQ